MKNLIQSRSTGGGNDDNIEISLGDPDIGEIIFSSHDTDDDVPIKYKHLVDPGTNLTDNEAQLLEKDIPEPIKDQYRKPKPQFLDLSGDFKKELHKKAFDLNEDFLV